MIRLIAHPYQLHLPPLTETLLFTRSSVKELEGFGMPIESELEAVMIYEFHPKDKPMVVRDVLPRKEDHK